MRCNYFLKVEIESYNSFKNLKFKNKKIVQVQKFNYAIMRSQSSTLEHTPSLARRNYLFLKC